MDNKLENWRKKSSDLSLGLSNGVIYDKALSLLPQNETKSSLMDFGAGQGVFIQKAFQKGHMSSYKAVDLMGKPSDVEGGIDWLKADLNDALPLEEASLDWITALEIIEHLENPRHVFRDLYRVLKKGGTLILSTPNNESWRAIVSYIFRGHFVAFTDSSYPAHIVALNRKDLLRAAKEAGFQDSYFQYSDSGCIPGWTKLTWQKLSFGVFKGLRFSDNLFIILKK